MFYCWVQMRCFDQRYIAWGARYIDSPETNLVTKRDYQRIWKGCYLVKLYIHNRSSYFEHSQALCGTNKDHSVIMWISAHTSSEKGGEQPTWHWQSISSVFSNISLLLQMHLRIGFSTPSLSSWKGIKRNYYVQSQDKKLDTSIQTTELTDVIMGSIQSLTIALKILSPGN